MENYPKINSTVTFICAPSWRRPFHVQGLVLKTGTLNLGGRYGKPQKAVQVKVLTEEYLKIMPRKKTWIALKNLIPTL